MPSILIVPDCGSNARCSSASAVDLPAPVEPTSAMVSPGSDREVEVGHGGALAVVGERHVLEVDQAAHAAGIDRVGAVAHRRHGVEHLEEFAQARRVHQHAVDEADHLLEAPDQQRGEIHEGDDLADGREALAVEVECRRRKIASIVMRGRRARQHRDQRPPGQHRHLRGQQLVDRRRAGSRPRPRCARKPCTSAMLPSASEVRSASAV